MVLWALTLHAMAQAPRSWKRGVAYALTSDADFAALSPNVSWWYNWHHSSAFDENYLGMEFVPMLWNFNFVHSTIVNSIKKHNSEYLLVLNEPNLIDQANMLPSAAAAEWPKYEAVSAETGVKIVGPAMTFGTLSGYHNPVTWLDEFFASYKSQHGKEAQVRPTSASHPGTATHSAAPRCAPRAVRRPHVALTEPLPPLVCAFAGRLPRVPLVRLRPRGQARRAEQIRQAGARVRPRRAVIMSAHFP